MSVETASLAILVHWQNNSVNRWMAQHCTIKCISFLSIMENVLQWSFKLNSTLAVVEAWDIKGQRLIH